MSSGLRSLARSYGVLTEYEDVHHRRQHASSETLRAVLHALGVSVASTEDVRAALADRRRELASQVVPPVLVAWDGALRSPSINLGDNNAEQTVRGVLTYEDGQRQDLPTRRLAELPEVLRRFSFARRGYHQLELTIGTCTHVARVISAPRATWSSPARAAQRSWGVFVPTYALHSQQSWGAGNLSDLETLWRWTAQRGGHLVATLPLLAAFLDGPVVPSPYEPASRLFWNEFYIDFRRAAEYECCERARQLATSAETQQFVDQLRAQDLVDYARQMALQRGVLQALADYCFTAGGDRFAALEQYVRQHPQLDNYARFRAATGRLGPWSTWPEHMKQGDLQRDCQPDVDESQRRYHLYVQWLAHEQIHGLIDRIGRGDTGLYLDLPLGVHRDGYDTWCNQDAYALGASGGAPPDAVFTKGQDWGFPPLHPHRLRARQYGHFIEYVRHTMQHAATVRIDHVMQLHRLYWVPTGMSARDGAYVTYPAEELYAIICLESHRNRCVVAGENLGTVSPEVNRSLRRHQLRQMYVAQYELNASSDLTLPEIPRQVVASVETHDMPPFAAYWNGDDLNELESLGLYDASMAADESAKREKIRRSIARLAQGVEAGGPESVSHPGPQGPGPEPPAELSAPAAIRLLHGLLAASPAEILLVTLEDLWLETQWQNWPGTLDERPNWRRKFRYTLEQIQQMPDVAEQLQHIAAQRDTSSRELVPAATVGARPSRPPSSL